MSGPEDKPQGQGPDDAKSPLADNPAGYVQPGRGLEDLAGEDHAFKKAAHRMEQLDQRESVASGSGGFKLDVEAMRELQGDWEDLARELQDLSHATRSLGNARPPANDEASTGQIEAVYKHARVCATIHQQMYQYARQYADSLGKAVKQVEGADHAAGEAAQNAGQGL